MERTGALLAVEHVFLGGSLLAEGPVTDTLVTGGTLHLAHGQLVGEDLPGLLHHRLDVRRTRGTHRHCLPRGILDREQLATRSLARLAGLFDGLLDLDLLGDHLAELGQQVEQVLVVFQTDYLLVGVFEVSVELAVVRGGQRQVGVELVTHVLLQVILGLSLFHWLL